LEQSTEKNGASENKAAEEKSGNGSSEPRIAELEAQVREKEQKYLYLYAEFENFKKRVIKERQDLMKFGWENVARELLEVVDNLERALEHMPKTETAKTLEQGLHMVLNQFRAALEKQGVQRIETVSETGSKDFDPNLHEAVAHVPSELPEGKIVREETRGYTLHGRLLRPARVVISGGKSSAS